MARSEVIYGVDCGFDGIGEILWLEVAEYSSLEPAPNALDGVEFRAGGRQPAEFDPQVVRQFATCPSSVGTAPIEEQHNVPSTPASADVSQVVPPGKTIPAVECFDAKMARTNVYGPE